MRESQFGFEYTWADLQPVRPLAVATFVAQVIGAAIGLAVSAYPSWFANLWAGGALATFPGFLLGLLLQYLLNAERIREHRVMVRRMGIIALVLTLSVFVTPLGKF